MAHQPPPKERGKRRRRGRPRSARMRIGACKSAAQLRALAGPSRTETRAELREVQLTVGSA
ncbi:hypothetical protein [Streptomyces sp. NBC_00878]|uniref:hypothetical protein n=1 Tax=Streptomyces sp. NBC_00878 TaxID=2975854 RepID=UPI0022594BC4|nr:hypothetical protein [Streptomyces sp. NBC_00878]MCX4906869.1 hypothetical protein [Streptomyces sp. NBC_00878]